VDEFVIIAAERPVVIPDGAVAESYS